MNHMNHMHHMRRSVLAVAVSVLLAGCGNPPPPQAPANPVAPGVLTREGGRYCFAWIQLLGDGRVTLWRGCADTASEALMLGNVLLMRHPDVKAGPPFMSPDRVSAPAEAERGLNAILSRPKPIACGAGKCG